MANLYKNYLKLLKQWPLDPSKPGRDLGEYLRKEVGLAFRSGDSFRGDVTDCMRKYDSLKRLADNHYCNKYKRLIQSTASGLSLQNCTSVLSKESLEILNNKKDVVKTNFDKIKDKFNTPIKKQASQTSITGGSN
jgi:nucleoid factor 1